MRVELKDASRILGQFRKSQNISWSCLLDINTWPCWLPPSPARAPPPAACASILVCASRPGRPASFNNATCPLRRTTGPAHRPITCYEAMGRNLKSAGIWPERTAARSPWVRDLMRACFTRKRKQVIGPGSVRPARIAKTQEDGYATFRRIWRWWSALLRVFSLHWFVLPDCASHEPTRAHLVIRVSTEA